MAAQAGPKWRPSGALDIAIRWILLWLCWAFASTKSGERLAEESRQGSLTVYVYSAYALAALAIIGVARRPWASLPIHDRQTDKIVGGMGLILAIGIQSLLVPRYPDHYQMLHLDAWAVGIFVLSGAVLLFGLRPIARFWQVWVFIFVFAPFPYRLLTLILGGQPVDAGIVMVFMAAVATAIAVGGTRRKALTWAAATGVLGGTVLAVLVLTIESPPRPLLQSVPALVAAGIVTTVALRPRGRLRFADPVAEPTARGVRGAVITLGVASAIMYALPLPPSAATPIGRAPAGVDTDSPLRPPAGWVQTGQQEYAWAKRFLGPATVLIRQRLVAREAVHDWDSLDRPRIVVVDSLRTTDQAALVAYPEGSLYPMTRVRRSPALDVDLGYDVTGRLYTVVDEGMLLTWTKLTFQWANDDVIERVSIFAVDDHRPEAVFPEPQASRSSFFGNIFTVLLRGNAVTTDSAPVYKDREMLESVGRALVSAQQGARR